MLIGATCQANGACGTNPQRHTCISVDASKVADIVSVYKRRDCACPTPPTPPHTPPPPSPPTPPSPPKPPSSPPSPTAPAPLAPGEQFGVTNFTVTEKYTTSVSALDAAAIAAREVVFVRALAELGLEATASAETGSRRRKLYQLQSAAFSVGVDCVGATTQLETHVSMSAPIAINLLNQITAGMPRSTRRSDGAPVYQCGDVVTAFEDPVPLAVEWPPATTPPPPPVAQAAFSVAVVLIIVFSALSLVCCVYATGQIVRSTNPGTVRAKMLAR